jgi:predicted DNA-binding mobile mystery protein A
MLRDHSLQTRRKFLDARLSPLKPEERFRPPPKGWIKAIRQALGMSGVQLASRLGVSPQTVDALENSEKNGRVQLETLRRAAEALDCTLVYALVPKNSLEDSINSRARDIASENLARASHSMKLEAQETDPTDRERQVQDYIWNYVSERDVWDKS